MMWCIMAFRVGNICRRGDLFVPEITVLSKLNMVIYIIIQVSVCVCAWWKITSDVFIFFIFLNETQRIGRYTVAATAIHEHPEITMIPSSSSFLYRLYNLFHPDE